MKFYHCAAIVLLSALAVLLLNCNSIAALPTGPAIPYHFGFKANNDTILKADNIEENRPGMRIDTNYVFKAKSKTKIHGVDIIDRTGAGVYLKSLDEKQVTINFVGQNSLSESITIYGSGACSLKSGISLALTASVFLWMKLQLF